eukprot:GEMP01022059.1.p1 GENE.GEMP01022059.1~~GEMP01022059.1.p1  ORF type:complete len:516 (+),score=89.39 GEMP01022059.1:155-1702(+)
MFLFALGVIVGALLNEVIRRLLSIRCDDAILLHKLKRIAQLFSHATRIALLREDSCDLADLINNQLEQLKTSEHDDTTNHVTYLAVDIGATRTKLKWVEVSAGGSTSERLLSPLPSHEVWGSSSSSSATQIFSTNEMTAVRATAAITHHLSKHDLSLDMVNRLVFSVPGTVDLSSVNRDNISVVKNMPSFSQSFRGFDFKKHFRPLCHPDSKVSAITDNLAAAMGVASTYPHHRSGLVIVLGTAPSVSTFYKQTDHITLGKQDPYLETAIWQSWVWFTKIELRDRFGYCGGIHVRNRGKTITLRDPESSKIPHGQARIRFALDNATWLRLLGKHPSLPPECQGHLSEEDATNVWAERLQSAVNALAQKFHMIYGPPDCIYVLGGNSMRLHGRVTTAEYEVPDVTRPQTNTVNVSIHRTDEDQQNVHINGQIVSTRYKVKQVFAPGNDPLSRGWTRGGEIYVWVPRFRGDALLKRRFSCTLSKTESAQDTATRTLSNHRISSLSTRSGSVSGDSKS